MFGEPNGERKKRLKEKSTVPSSVFPSDTRTVFFFLLRDAVVVRRADHRRRSLVDRVSLHSKVRGNAWWPHGSSIHMHKAPYNRGRVS